MAEIVRDRGQPLVSLRMRLIGDGDLGEFQGCFLELLLIEQGLRQYGAGAEILLVGLKPPSRLAFSRHVLAG
jgi:hypothetical protein